MAHIVSNGVEYGKPNIYAMEGEMGRRIMERIRNTPRVDYERLRRESDEIAARIREAQANGTY